MPHILIADQNLNTQKDYQHYFINDYDLYFPCSIEDECFNNLDNYSLAIIDCKFSNNQGLLILKQIKPLRPCLPVIFTSYQITEYLCLDAFKLGARDCFVKPFSLENIAESIKLILNFPVINKRNRKNLLFPKYIKDIPSNNYHSYIHPSIEKAKKFIEENYYKHLSVLKIAHIVSLSEYHFCRIFKKQVGICCSEYINSIRIKEAKKLLMDNKLSITDVCFSVGYNDLTYFERVFKKIEGYCPNTYKKSPH